MNYKNIFSFLALLLFSTACEDYVDESNISPNNPTSAPLNNIIVAAQVNFAGFMEGEDARLAGMWAQQFSGEDRQYSAYQVYNITTEAFSWFPPYIGTLQQLEIAIAEAEEVGNRSTAGMLKVMKGATFGTLTSLYGDIPFTEALQAPENSDPVYDEQAVVYAGVQTILDEAIADLSTGQGSILTDILAGGDEEAWLQAAHTFKARFYLHVGDYTQAVEQAQIGLSNPENNLVMQHGDVFGGNINLYFDFLVLNRAGYMEANEAFLPLLLDSTTTVYRGNEKTDETARLNFYYVPTETGYNINTTEEGIFDRDAPFTILSYRENQLILAEALVRQSAPDVEGSLEALNDVRAVNEELFPEGTYEAYDQEDFEAGGIANTGQASAQAALLQEVLEERYATLFGQIEVFNDLRRTNNALGLTPTTGTTFPQRFLYPTSELTANENAPELPDLFEPTDVNQ
jgi:hypothetical protein